MDQYCNFSERDRTTIHKTVESKRRSHSMGSRTNLAKTRRRVSPIMGSEPAMTQTSLIITVLNEEKTIVALLEAILKQTLQPDEVVICDGGSSDATVKLIEDFAQKNQK